MTPTHMLYSISHLLSRTKAGAKSTAVTESGSVSIVEKGLI